MVCYFFFKFAHLEVITWLSFCQPCKFSLNFSNSWLLHLSVAFSKQQILTSPAPLQQQQERHKEVSVQVDGYSPAGCLSGIVLNHTEKTWRQLVFLQYLFSGQRIFPRWLLCCGKKMLKHVFYVARRIYMYITQDYCYYC